ncbi:MAG: riboflavin synthase [Deltaproteobacteria bacterium]|nr:riboflavin synthase [Deltaproteobacteria bacterium]
MFTGLVEDTGTIAAVQGQRVVVDTALDLVDTKIGDSIAVDGVCLTAVVVEQHRVAFDVGPETLAVSAFATNLKAGRRVHLERAMRLSDRLGGHLVAGHVDGIGKVISKRPDGDALYVRFAAPPAVLDLCIFKGSIAIDGVSLTLNVVDDDGFDVCLIPHTLQQTHLNDLRPGDLVNLESDLIGKYVQRLISRKSSSSSSSSITWDLLKTNGFTE